MYKNQHTKSKNLNDTCDTYDTYDRLSKMRKKCGLKICILEKYLLPLQYD